MSLRLPRFSGRDVMRRKAPIGRSSPHTSKKIQAICNGKSTPFTMQGLATTREKPPAQEQWGAMEKTMGSNEKNNGKNNGNKQKSGRMPMSGCGAARQATALCARRCPAEQICWQDLRMNLGAKQSAPEAQGSGRANVTLHLLPCAARAWSASGIRSIPTIQGRADHGPNLGSRCHAGRPRRHKSGGSASRRGRRELGRYAGFIPNVFANRSA
jgi:hypothetical protein